jgi:hypothetical protein
MYFCWDITIPANTLEKLPLRQYLRITKGVITKVDVKFPAGCHKMVKTRLYRHEQQAIPLTRDEWVTGDDEAVPTEIYIDLNAYPYQLKLVACSPDTDYDHTITVRIQVLPSFAAGFAQITNLVQKLLDKLGFSND